MSVLYGGIEAGGTKFVCALGSGPDDLQDEVRFATTTPEETIGRAIEYFQQQNAKEPLSALGIGSFGPVDLQRDSATYGYITTTPKQGWLNTDFAGVLKKAFNIPIGFDTDVNAAALGEYCWGAAKGLTDFIYLTIGTGIGGGGMINGRLMHGLIHPEMGHVRIPHDIKLDPYPGKCPFHKDCFEGLAAGPALQERWGVRAQDLKPDHQAWDLEAGYIALALVNYICTLSPQRIIIGGGVLEQKQMLGLVRDKVKKELNNYVQAKEITDRIEDYIVLPGLGNRAGILGAIALAKAEAEKIRQNRVKLK
ncbi:MAG: ROK family protein [Candidatus Omnitrophica bacterium]|nr:ROK family protein [Candidatus Omnitrophota bacterium]